MDPQTLDMLRRMGKAAWERAPGTLLASNCPLEANEAFDMGLAALREMTTGNCRTCLLDSHRCPWAEDVPNTHTLISPNQRKAGAECPAAQAKEAGDGG